MTHMPARRIAILLHVSVMAEFAGGYIGLADRTTAGNGTGTLLPVLVLLPLRMKLTLVYEVILAQMNISILVCHSGMLLGSDGRWVLGEYKPASDLVQ